MRQVLHKFFSFFLISLIQAIFLISAFLKTVILFTATIGNFENYGSLVLIENKLKSVQRIFKIKNSIL